MKDFETLEYPAIEYKPSIVHQAEEIVDMYYELKRLRVVETKYHALKKQYEKQQDEALDHAQKMMGQVLNVAMKCDLSKIKEDV